MFVDLALPFYLAIYLFVVSVLSTRGNAPKDELALMPLNHTLGGAEETTVYIDKIITIREVTSMGGGRVDEDSQVRANFDIGVATFFS